MEQRLALSKRWLGARIKYLNASLAGNEEKKRIYRNRIATYCVRYAEKYRCADYLAAEYEMQQILKENM
jgi:hypothetical protein